MYMRKPILDFTTCIFPVCPVIMALMSLERDIEALTSVLEQISEVRDHNPNALDSEQVRAQVRQAIKITQQRRPLQKIFELRPVPWNLPYKQFFFSRMNAQHLSIMTRSLYSLTRSCDFANKFKEPGLCPMGTEFFVTVFDWIDYILPIGREKALEDVEYQHVNFLMTAFTHSALYTVLEVFQYLPHERLREIVLHPEQRLSAILVRAWLKWPHLQRLLCDGEELDAKIVEGCAIGFPMFYRTLQDDDLRHKVLSELMHPIGYNPRRFWLRYARHTLCNQNRVTFTRTFTRKYS